MECSIYIIYTCLCTIGSCLKEYINGTFHSAEISKISGQKSNGMEKNPNGISGITQIFVFHSQFVSDLVSQATRDRLKARESLACLWK